MSWTMRAEGFERSHPSAKVVDVSSTCPTMNNVSVLFVAASALLLAACPGLGSQEPPTADDLPENPTWSADVKPVLDRLCNECHSVPPQQAAPGNLRLDVCETVAGIPGARVMSQRIIARTIDRIPSAMPPQTYPEQPTPDDEEILRRWVEQGANCDEDIDPNNVNSNNTTGDMGIDSVDTGSGMSDTGMIGMDTGMSGMDAGTDAGVDMPPTVDPQFAMVQTIVNTNCALANCHADGDGGLTLPQNGSVEEIMGAFENGMADNPNLPWITDMDPSQSAVYRRISTDGNEGFNLMPAGGAGPLEQTEIETIESWIQDGAPYFSN